MNVMFMGVVGRPVESKIFDGHVHLERVSKAVEVKKLTSHQNFSDDVLVNSEIKQGGWKHLHTEGMIVGKLRDSIQLQYALDDAVVDRIVFTYKTKIRNKGNTRWVSIIEYSCKLEGTIRIEDDAAVPGRPLTIEDLTTKVRYRCSDIIEVDCSCDSAYMLTAMDHISKSIRDAYHWVPCTEKC